MNTPTTPKEITITLTRDQALNLLRDDALDNEPALQLKRALLGPLPAWVTHLEHAAQMSVRAFCACSAAPHCWLVGGPALLARCPACNARDVHEAKACGADPAWPRWTFDLLHAYHEAHGSRPLDRFPFDRVRTWFEKWCLTRYPKIKEPRLQYYLNGHHPETGAPEGPPGWYVAGFDFGDSRAVHIVDLNNDRACQDEAERASDRVRGIYALDLEAGEVLATMLVEELKRGVWS